MTSGMGDLGWTAPGAGRDPVDIVLIGWMAEDTLSLAYLASSCEHHDLRAELVGYVDLDELDAVEARTLALGPQVVGLSIPCQAHAAALMRLADRLRQAGFRGHLCAGGHFATLACEQLLRDARSIDSIVLHDGEETLVHLLSLLCRSPDPTAAPLDSVLGLAFRCASGAIVRTAPRNASPVDALPWPRRSGRTMRRMDMGVASILGSRGPCQERIAPRPPRERSVAELVREIAWLRRDREVCIFDLVDDCLLDASRSRLLALRAALRSAGLEDVSLVIRACASELDEATIGELIGSQVLWVDVAMDSSNERALAVEEREARAAQGARALARLERCGLGCAFEVPLFGPDTTMQSVSIDLDLMQARAGAPQCFSRVQLCESTPWHAQLLAAGRLRGSYLAWSYDIEDPRADLLSRIANVAFHCRNFQADGLANASLAMRFDVEVLKRYHTAYHPSLLDAAIEFSRRTVGSTVRHLRAAHAFCGSVDLDDASAIQVFATQMEHAVRRDDAAGAGEAKALRAALDEALQSSASR